MEDINSTSIGRRLQTLLDYLKLTPLDFSRKIGDERSEKVVRVIRGENKPSYEMLRNIGKTFPEVDLNWLITGFGNLAKSSNKTGSPVQVKVNNELALVPCVTAYVHREYIKSYDKPTFLASLPIVEEEAYNDYVYRDFEVPNECAYPYATKGDIMRGRYMDPDSLSEDFFNNPSAGNAGGAWVLKDGIYLGVGRDLDPETGLFTIKFFNGAFPHKHTSLKEVLEYWDYKEMRITSKRPINDGYADPSNPADTRPRL